MRWRITLLSPFTWKVEKHDFTLCNNIVLKIMLSAFYKLKPIKVILRTLLSTKNIQSWMPFNEKLLFTKPMYKFWFLRNRMKQYCFLKLNYLQHCSLTRKISSHALSNSVSSINQKNLSTLGLNPTEELHTSKLYPIIFLL